MEITRDDVIKLRKEYKPGTCVELVEMDDPQAPPVGTRGIVRGVDDMGSIMVSWDNGSSLSVLYGNDKVKKVEITADSVKFTNDELDLIYDLVCSRSVRLTDNKYDDDYGWQRPILKAMEIKLERFLWSN